MIRLVRSLGFLDIWAEVDSSVDIRYIIKGGGPLAIQGILEKIAYFISFDKNIVSHNYREENQVVDALAANGWNHLRYQTYGQADLPRHIRALLQVDRHGLPSIRI